MNTIPQGNEEDGLGPLRIQPKEKSHHDNGIKCDPTRNMGQEALPARGFLKRTKI
jgi:hypothetical protein